MASKRHHSTTGDALLSLEGRKVAFKLAQGRCLVCRRRMWVHTPDRQRRLTIDHVTAHACGGAARGNFAPLCGSCNSSKSDSDLEAWLPARLVSTKRATTLRGARSMVKRVAGEVYAQRDALTAALIEEGIWT